jgi:hypothetical protein
MDLEWKLRCGKDEAYVGGWVVSDLGQGGTVLSEMLNVVESSG